MNETLYTKMAEIVKPYFTSQSQRFISLAASPWFPIIVVEFQVRQRNRMKEGSRQYKMEWRDEFRDVRCINFPGLMDLWKVYAKSETTSKEVA